MHFFIFEPQVGDAGNRPLAALLVHKKLAGLSVDAGRHSLKLAFISAALLRRNGRWARRLEKPRCKVFQIAAPRLPFMRGAWRLVKDVLDVGLCESIVQLD